MQCFNWNECFVFPFSIDVVWPVLLGLRSLCQPRRSWWFHMTWQHVVTIPSSTTICVLCNCWSILPEIISRISLPWERRISHPHRFDSDSSSNRCVIDFDSNDFGIRGHVNSHDKQTNRSCMLYLFLNSQCIISQLARLIKARPLGPFDEVDPYSLLVITNLQTNCGN